MFDKLRNFTLFSLVCLIIIVANNVLFTTMAELELHRTESAIRLEQLIDSEISEEVAIEVQQLSSNMEKYTKEAMLKFKLIGILIIIYVTLELLMLVGIVYTYKWLNMLTIVMLVIPTFFMPTLGLFIGSYLVVFCLLEYREHLILKSSVLYTVKGN